MTRRLSSAFLCLAVSISALLGVGAHEHTASTLQFATSCLIDHAHEVDSDHPRSPHVEAAEAGHQHECIGCHASRLRFATLTPGAELRAPKVAEAAIPAPVHDAETQRLLGPSPRGPPETRPRPTWV